MVSSFKSHTADLKGGGCLKADGGKKTRPSCFFWFVAICQRALGFHLSFLVCQLWECSSGQFRTLWEQSDDSLRSLWLKSDAKIRHSHGDTSNFSYNCCDYQWNTANKYALYAYFLNLFFLHLYIWSFRYSWVLTVFLQATGLLFAGLFQRGIECFLPWYL